MPSLWIYSCSTSLTLPSFLGYSEKYSFPFFLLFGSCSCSCSYSCSFLLLPLPLLILLVLLFYPSPFFFFIISLLMARLPAYLPHFFFVCFKFVLDLPSASVFEKEPNFHNNTSHFLKFLSSE